jgi:transposase InsO family protein
MSTAIGRYGVPMISLTDNGLCYSTKRRLDHRPAAFEANLAVLGCQSIASTPYHPQGRGKIERFLCATRRPLLSPVQLGELEGRFSGLMAYPDTER